MMVPSEYGTWSRVAHRSALCIWTTYITTLNISHPPIFDWQSCNWYDYLGPKRRWGISRSAYQTYLLFSQVSMCQRRCSIQLNGVSFIHSYISWYTVQHSFLVFLFRCAETMIIYHLISDLFMYGSLITCKSAGALCSLVKREWLSYHTRLLVWWQSPLSGQVQ